MLIPTIIEKENGGERAYDIYSKLLKDRIVILGDQVTNESANSVIAQLLYLDSISHDDITLYINSPGGSVTAGMGIYDVMNFIKSDVSTICVGMAASMGAFLLSCGAKGKRYCLPNSEVMIHQPLGGTGEAPVQTTDMEIAARHLLKTKERLIGIMAKNAGKEYEQVVADCERDNWLSAKEALDYGLVDGILGEEEK